ncbi:MAG: LysM peptidoglycan-binding domain-containing protein, partial [Anaerolineae bacterium]|nr:LysM peptidoglycan-binding domain-containing protein [Anaerolineae bacterium]
MKYILRAIVLILLITLAISIATPAAAQCQVRTDWGIYVVQRGDSLSQIARTNSVSLDELIRGNCLSTTTIFAGQQLRVPGAPQSGPTSVVQNPNGTYFTSATYRTFENGFMLWTSNNGTIYVFRTDGHVTSYALSRYGNLPIPDTNVEIPPAERFAPSFGMARVWYNFPEVRTTLGWATQAGEGRYDAFFQMPSFGSFFTMTLWDSRFIRVNLDGTWTSIDVTPTSTSTSQPGFSAGATFQPFENGFMVWRSDNGEIRVYIGGDSGELTIYNNAQYANLPLIRGFTAPAGRLVPDGGFGRVWRNFENIRSRIGYAIGGEQGYTMGLVQAGNDIVGFSLPDRRFVYGSGSQWRIAPDYYPPTPVNTLTPSPTGPTPTYTATYTPSPTLTVSPSATFTGSEPSIGTTFQMFEGGFMLWRADTSDIWVFFSLGGDSGEIAVIPNVIYGLLPINRVLTPPPGRIRPDNGFGRVWSNFTEVRQRLGWATTGEQGYLMTARL